MTYYIMFFHSIGVTQSRMHENKNNYMQGKQSTL